MNHLTLPSFNFQRAAILGLLMALGLAAPSASEAAEQNPDPRFPLSTFEISGNTLLSQETLDAAVAPYLGLNQRFADVEVARQSLEAAYLAAGYSTVRVTLPEQEIVGGKVRIAVQELQLRRIEILPGEHHDAENVRNSLPDLKSGVTPKTARVAESLRLANDNPSKQTHLLLKPDPVSGAVDALVRVEDEKPWKIFATADNTGTPETGRTRVGLGFQHANLFNLDHVATVQYVTSGERSNDVQIYGLGYRIPLYGLANAIDIFAGHSDVDSGTVSGLFNVSGKGDIVGLRYTLNLPKTGAFENKFVAGLEYRAYENDIDQSGISLGNQVAVHPFSFTGSSNWKGEGTQAGGYVSWLINLPGGNNGEDADFANARTGADADYRMIRAGGNLSQQLFSDWQIRLAFDGQYTNEPLVPGEQFGIGGQDSVRGFGERVVSGDRGWRSGLELYTPDIGNITGLPDARWRFSVFYEGGSVNRVNPLPGEQAAEGISSTGVGTRFGLGRALSIRLDYGYVLDGAGTILQGDYKLHGSVAYVY